MKKELKTMEEVLNTGDLYWTFDIQDFIENYDIDQPWESYNEQVIRIFLRETDIFIMINNDKFFEVYQSMKNGDIIKKTTISEEDMRLCIILSYMQDDTIFHEKNNN